MAESKKSATKKKTTKKTTEKKESKKQPKMVKLTFRPLFSAATNYTVSLTEKKITIDDGIETIHKLPAIEGLPRLLTIHAGEIVEVTQSQFKQLQAFGCIESKEQLEKRKAIEANIKNQHPNRITYEMHDRQYDPTINSRTSSKLYNDKFIVVE